MGRLLVRRPSRRRSPARRPSQFASRRIRIAVGVGSRSVVARRQRASSPPSDAPTPSDSSGPSQSPDRCPSLLRPTTFHDSLLLSRGQELIRQASLRPQQPCAAVGHLCAAVPLRLTPSLVTLLVSIAQSCTAVRKVILRITLENENVGEPTEPSTNNNWF